MFSVILYSNQWCFFFSFSQFVSKFYFVFIMAKPKNDHFTIMGKFFGKIEQTVAHILALKSIPGSICATGTSFKNSLTQVRCTLSETPSIHISDTNCTLLTGWKFSILDVVHLKPDVVHSSQHHLLFLGVVHVDDVWWGTEVWFAVRMGKQTVLQVTGCPFSSWRNNVRFFNLVCKIILFHFNYATLFNS